MSTVPSLRASVPDLLARMTLREKVGQMTQLCLEALAESSETSASHFRFDPKRLRKAVAGHAIGSVLNIFEQAFSMRRWRGVVGQIQRVATEETRLGIPVVFGIDSVHGANYALEGTIFPHNLNLAATWNPELARRVAEAASRQTLACAIPWTFAPVLDLGRQALWSRFCETFGEDPLLASRMGEAAVRGFQADPRMAACGKHFLGYGSPRTGRDRTPAWIPEHALREYFLPPFQAAVEAGVKTIMVNSGEVNGLPVHANRWLLTDLLRGELGFQGVVVTDWQDIIRLHTVHRVAPDLREAVRLAVEAGVDMSMTPHSLTFCDILAELVEEGRLAEERIDASVRRILQLKRDLGLFEDPLPDARGEAVRRQDGELALEAARQSIVLLKNDGALPFKRQARILLAGPAARSLPELHGPWTYTWQGSEPEIYPPRLDTLADALRRDWGDRLTCLPGADHDREIDVEAAARALAECDAAVCALAERPSVEKPGDIDDLNLPQAQKNLAAALLATGKPVILALFTGRPRLLADEAERAAAVLWAGYPGNLAGQALADILAGRVNPCGRLPFTYPRHHGALFTYDHKPSEKEDRNLGMKAFDPLFQFGSGLAYTEFGYSRLKLSAKRITRDEALRVKVTVENKGAREGVEVVQLYLSDLYASLTPANKRLARFERVRLRPGQKRRLEFELTAQDLSFVGPDNRWIAEPGEFEIRLGPLKAAFRLL